MSDTTDAHEHEDGSSHAHDEQVFGPQPVGMGIAADVAVMADGTDRVMVTYTSVNGSWTVFYDRPGAIAHAQTLLSLAYQPPLQQPVEEAVVSDAVKPPPTR